MRASSNWLVLINFVNSYSASLRQTFFLSLRNSVRASPSCQTVRTDSANESARLRVLVRVAHRESFNVDTAGYSSILGDTALLAETLAVSGHVSLALYVDLPLSPSFTDQRKLALSVCSIPGRSSIAPRSHFTVNSCVKLLPANRVHMRIIVLSDCTIRNITLIIAADIAVFATTKKKLRTNEIKIEFASWRPADRSEPRSPVIFV